MIVAVVLAVAVLSLPLAVAPAVLRTDTATITGPAGVTSLPLSESGVYRVAGRIGEVYVAVADGRVYVHEADCPDGRCTRSGHALPGRPVVCAPNGVSVSVSHRGEAELDAVSR